MATAWIYADTLGQTLCRGAQCRAKITWAEMVSSGKKMCFDGEPKPLEIADRLGRPVWQVDLQTTHWRSCPDQQVFRRKDPQAVR
jgi:hypothetical protein